jgi:hypothetical protein
MFSGTKQIVTDRRSRLGEKEFEELTVMKSAWGPDIYDAAAWNSAQVEEIGLADFKEMLIDDSDAVEWDKALSTSWNQWDEELIV